MFSFFKSSKPPALPPVCSECVQTLTGPMSGAIPQTSSVNQYRSIDGMVRMDMGNLSMISNPATGERILLNHLTMQARILPPMPGAPQMPGMAMPAMPGMPQMPGMAMPGMPPMGGAANIVQLGKSMIDGHPVTGVRYLFPQTGLTPPSLQSWEVWNSTKLNVPVMTQSIGSFGQSTRICKVSPTPPSPTMFQVPPNYSVVQPGMPAATSVSGAPSMNLPGLPNAPSMPAAPNVSQGTPSGPGLPSMPAANLPSTPNVPATPSVPSAPGIPAAPNLSPPPVPNTQQAPKLPSISPPKFPGLK